MPASFFKRTAAGGVFVTKVNERSSYTVISTGMIIPAWSEVRALNSLQNPMMFTPACPKAGPTGGAGLALPAGICSLTTLETFLATPSNSLQKCGSLGSNPPTLNKQPSGVLRNVAPVPDRSTQTQSHYHSFCQNGRAGCRIKVFPPG